MSKKMLINASHPEENRVAIVVDGLLSELDIEIAGQEQTKGNIYKAVVVRVETGLQAAFVDFGAEKLGFLQIGEIHPSLYPGKDDGKSRPRINDILHRGQEILVQVVKEERGNKGAALTTNLSLPGRYMVLMPDSTTKGVSRKIQDEPERKKLKRTMAELNLPERMGYIVRTAGIGKEKDELKRDFNYLVRLFEGIVARKDQIKAPAQLYQESNLMIRSIRDYFSTEMDEVLIDDDKVFKDAKDFFTLVMPELEHLVKQHRERRPIFSRYQIEEQIDGLAKNQIPLPSGGSIVIDQTEALVAIDVNSGKMSSESGIEATAAKTNLEAAAEIGRQLRLRDLGGLIVIDFIDMRDRKHIREVEQETRKALKDDKAKVSVGRISQFGLLEMSRQRLKPTLSVGSYLDCPHCLGKGRIKTAENQSVALLRQIHSTASKGHIGHIQAKVPIDVANDMHNSKRQSLLTLEKRLNLKVTILGCSDMLPGELELETYKREQSSDSNRAIAPVTHANQIEIALAAAELPDEPEVLEEVDSLSEDDGPDIEIKETEAEAEKEESKSRRRRRRRRKKSDRHDEPGTEQAEQTGSATDTAAEPSEPTANVQPLEQKTAAELKVSVQETLVPSPEAGTETATEKPKRRSRRPRRKSPVVTTPVVSDTHPASDGKPAELLTPVVAEPSGEAAPAEEKPKRRPRRTTKKPAAKPAPPAAVSATEAVVAEEKPKSRPRRTTKKPTEVATPTETSSVTEKPATEKPKRQTRSTAKKAPEETAPAVTSPASETTTALEKPKRAPGRPRKKPVAASADAVAGKSSSSAEKPKRRPGRPRKVTPPEDNS